MCNLSQLDLVFRRVLVSQECHKAIRADPSPAPKAAYTPNKAYKNTVRKNEWFEICGDFLSQMHLAVPTFPYSAVVQ